MIIIYPAPQMALYSDCFGPLESDNLKYRNIASLWEWEETDET